MSEEMEELAEEPVHSCVQAGSLYLVATPLGNRGDITQRALEVLRSVDVIACEDTRTSGKLLSHYAISKPLLPYHDHNERQQTDVIVEKLHSGQSVALITDAGSPNISDPGFCLVRACRKLAIPLYPIPGASALVLALSASGLPTHQFFYAGFLAPKTSARCRFFEKHREADYSIVLYESCHRIQKCVDDIIDTLGDERYICLARELTKLHETFLVGTATDVRTRLTGVQTKGEFVVVIAPQGYSL